MTPSDGPSAAEPLDWIIGVLWEGLPGVSVSRGRTSVGAGSGLPTEEYLVLPTAAEPRMLLPAQPRIAAAAMASGNGLRRRKDRLQRSATGLAFRSGLARSIFRGSVRVHVEPGSEGSTLAGALAEVFGRPVGLAINVRPAGPYRKPVVQVLSTDGQTLAYAKIAWNEVTERNVTAEGQALAELASADVAIRAPEMAPRLRWRGHTVLLTSPMPEGLRRYPTSAGPPSAGVTHSVATIRQGSRSNLSASGHAANLGQRFAAASRVAPEISDAATTALDLVLARSAEVPVEHGSWHGDWAPWNLGLAGSTLWAWDWEYSREGVALGIDLPHWYFQRAFIQQRASFADALVATRAAEGALSELGMTSAQVDATLALHRLEVVARYLDAMVLGASPNPRFLTGSVATMASIPSDLGRG